MAELKSDSNKRKSPKLAKSMKDLKTDPDIGFELAYYNDYWSNTKEYNWIENGLYLGSDIPVKDIYAMEKLGVNQIISVKEEPVPERRRIGHIVYHHIEAGDFPDQDLLSVFDSCYQIIVNAIRNGESVYVNCGGGVSRSATIVIAYIMKKYRLSYTDALKRVTKRRKVFPNEGFIEQLNLYERMQWFADGSNQAYRIFILKSLTYQLRTNGMSTSSRSSLKRDVERQLRFNYETKCVRQYFDKVIAAEQSAHIHGRPVYRGITYKCYYCNLELFSECNIIGVNVDGVGPVCKNLFIEPMPTYCTQPDEQKTGYLKCPNCMRIFGSYNWLLYQCNCALHQPYKECLALRIYPLKISYRSIRSH